MEIVDKKEFAEVMFALAENFSQKLTVSGVTLRFEALKNYPIEKIKAAAVEILKTRKYTSLPTVADFVEAIECPSQRDLDAKASLQAIEVLNAVRRFGAYQCVCFADPLTNWVVTHKFGGWIAVCQTETPRVFIEREFKDAYLLAARYQKVSYDALPGVHGGNNPIMIGEKEDIKNFYEKKEKYEQSFLGVVNEH